MYLCSLGAGSSDDSGCGTELGAGAGPAVGADTHCVAAPAMAVTPSSGTFPDVEWATIVRMGFSRLYSTWRMRLASAIGVATVVFDSKVSLGATAGISAQLDFPAWAVSSLDTLYIK
jgi:hypothetical protein